MGIKVKNKPLILICLVALVLVSCKRKQEPNKLLDGIPVNTTETVIPAQAAQQLFLLKRDALNIIIPAINRFGEPNVSSGSFGELSGPGAGSEYTFRTSNPRYGDVTFTMQFRDPTNAVIDPITNIGSSNTISGVTYTANSASSLFSYSENLAVTLDTAGNIESTKRVTGTSVFTGQGFTITYTFASPGLAANFEGLIQGTLTGSGTGPTSLPTSITLTYSTDHSSDGTITWENRQGTIHFDDTGIGSIITNQTRLLID